MMFTNLTSYLLLITLYLVLYFVYFYCCLPFLVRFDNSAFERPFRNGNRTEWSPIRSVIIRVINKIGRPRSGSPICLITSMITDRVGRHEVLLPINHNSKFVIYKTLFKIKTQEIPRFFLLEIKKKTF